jgi:sugar lactone lactonase YvrE
MIRSVRFSSTTTCRNIRIAVMFSGIVLAGSGQARAALLYATALTNNQIDAVDTVANTVTTFLNTPSAADSIIFDGSGRLIYTELYANSVWRYDPITLTNVMLASGFGTPADMVLEPGGNSMLVSDYSGGSVFRINLTNNTVTTLLSPGGNPEGLAYDGNRLFVNLGLRYGGPTAKYVAEINPTNGAILAVSPGLNSLDGLTYDPYSGRLFASSVLGNTVYAIDPNNLSNVTDLSSKLGSIPAPDGITTDGTGDVFVASSDSLGDGHVYQIDLINHTLTQKTYVPGLDDLAPASGLGSLIPEPTTWLLTALGFGCLPPLLRRTVRYRKQHR